MKAFMAAAGEVSKSSERDRLYKSFREMVHAPTPAHLKRPKQTSLGLPMTMREATLRKTGQAFHTCGHDTSVTGSLLPEIIQQTDSSRKMEKSNRFSHHR